MIIDCISDLHGYYPKLEGGDLLIIGGDLTAGDEPHEYREFTDWLCNYGHGGDYDQVVIIGGNHDNKISTILHCWGRLDGVHYLCDARTEFEGLKIWGSPWTKTFPGMNPHCKAFTVDTDEELAEKWSLIPHDTDILVTHSPPYDFGDHIKTEWNDYFAVGSESLYFKVTEICPKLHVFGHIHEGHGLEKRDYFPRVTTQTVLYVNASHVNEYYKPVNKPIRVIL